MGYRYLKGHIPWNKGKCHSEETKRKIREARIKYCQSHDSWNKGKPHLVGKDNPMFGKHHSEEAKEKISRKTLQYLAEYGHPLKNKHHSEETKKNISLGRKGKLVNKNNPNWKGGISKLGYPCNFNAELKELIRRRDNYKCQLCGVPQQECLRKLDVHHVDYDKENLNPKNLISLCNKCNIKVNFGREKWQSKLRLLLLKQN